MPDKIQETYVQWISAAQEDLRLAQTLFEHEKDFYPSICFHAQQAVEKSLKAFLYFHRIDEEFRGHRLEALLQRCIVLEASLQDMREAIAILDQYYVPTRYPDALPGMSPSGMYREGEAQEAIKYAEKIISAIAGRMQ